LRKKGKKEIIEREAKILTEVVVIVVCLIGEVNINRYIQN
jgi:hypothetical protein